MKQEYKFGFHDDAQADRPFQWKFWPLLFALLFLTGSWLFLTQKILFGENWLSETYDNIDWRTNEGNLQTYGAWDLETHIWKSDFIMEHWPNVLWNPYWYLGMPLFKYYQVGFYVLHIGVIKLLGLHPAFAANMIVIFGHLAAVFMTFLLCLRVSRRYSVAALCSFFLLANTFLSLRSYGWEPITVVFLWLYPLGLYVFLRRPLQPFRFWMIIVLALSYLMHPLIWFSLCMTMGLYLLTLTMSTSRKNKEDSRAVAEHHVLTQYFALVVCSLLLGGIQSVPQFTYQQVTSGAHMGVKYLPFYHIEYNIISVKDFFFDYGNLKGPGPIVMIALLFLIVSALVYIKDINSAKKGKNIFSHAILKGFAVTVVVMVLFYYLEAFNIFPMNILRSVQYHRIIPEFIIASAVLIAALSTQLRSVRMKIFYYSTLTAFIIGGMFVIYDVQLKWQTVPDITEKPEFITEDIPGRISMPYTEQSLSVRNSFTKKPQVYGYYEQGITSPYDDELFSVSSGFHNTSMMVLYLRAADVSRIYVNKEAGIRNTMVQQRLNGTLPLIDQNYRYAYYSVPIKNPEFAQAVPESEVDYVQSLRPRCREMYKVVYCGSVGEEFVGKDEYEVKYLEAYVNMLENPYNTTTEFIMTDPDHYRIKVFNATKDTAIVIKMNNDQSWHASVQQQGLKIESIGPDFMLVRPRRQGNYEVQLVYRLNREYFIGAILSTITFICLVLYFTFKSRISTEFKLREGDMRESP